MYPYTGVGFDICLPVNPGNLITAAGLNINAPLLTTSQEINKHCIHPAARPLERSLQWAGLSKWHLYQDYTFPAHFCHRTSDLSCFALLLFSTSRQYKHQTNSAP
jgi:hypothetical protein